MRCEQADHSTSLVIPSLQEGHPCLAGCRRAIHQSLPRPDRRGEVSLRGLARDAFDAICTSGGRANHDAFRSFQEGRFLARIDRIAAAIGSRRPKAPKGCHVLASRQHQQSIPIANSACLVSYSTPMHGGSLLHPLLFDRSHKSRLE